MNTANTGREVILQRIQAALRDVPPTEQPEDVVVTRTYLHNCQRH